MVLSQKEKEAAKMGLPVFTVRQAQYLKFDFEYERCSW